MTKPQAVEPGQTCAKCADPISDPAELWPVEGGLCQCCWEAFSGDQWWEAVKDLEPTGYPDEYRRVGSSLPLSPKNTQEVGS